MHRFKVLDYGIQCQMKLNILEANLFSKTLLNIGKDGKNVLVDCANNTWPKLAF